MTPEQRRTAILQVLQHASEPVSATQLARQFSVSRQIIVGDVALLRVGGSDIAATPRGYVMAGQGSGLRKTIACLHDETAMEQELNLMVDQGCTVLDVVVEHPVYGQLTGNLQLKSRGDVRQFLAAARSAAPLSALTDGIHLHHLLCPDEAAFSRVWDALQAAGILVEQSD